jgi:hypothetical protein
MRNAKPQESKAKNRNATNINRRERYRRKNGEL